MATDQVDGWLARRQGRTTPLGSLLDPVADKVLVLATMIVLVGEDAFRGGWWRQSSRASCSSRGCGSPPWNAGIVLQARDLGKLKTWSQAVAAALGGFAVAGAWSTSVAWWGLLVAVALTWISGLDYARDAPALLATRSRLIRRLVLLRVHLDRFADAGLPPRPGAPACRSARRAPGAAPHALPGVGSG